MFESVNEPNEWASRAMLLSKQQERAMYTNWREFFDPLALANIGAAFDIAWDFIQKSENPSFTDPTEQRAQLASTLLWLARTGETNELILANRAINRIRDSHSLRPPGAVSVELHVLVSA